MNDLIEALAFVEDLRKPYLNKMTVIIQKISFVEFCFSVQSFLDEWEYFNPDEEPTQEDYDDWVKTLTYDTLKDPDHSPTVKLIEDN